MENEIRKDYAAPAVPEPDCPVLTVLNGTTTLRIGLHFSGRKKETADDIFHRLVAEKAKEEATEGPILGTVQEDK